MRPSPFARPFSNLPPPLPLFINGTQIALEESARDLSIVVDLSLKFHNHISLTKSKAFGVSQNILHGTICRSPEFMRQIFIAHICPIMDFCSPLWNTGYIGDCRSLESIQRRWTRDIDGFSNLSYHDRLSRLSLYSVWGRCLRADLILVWKIMHGVIPCRSDILVRSTVGRTRGHPIQTGSR